MLADSLRTDRRSFRQLQVQAPPVIELREWSRLTAELQEERNGLINRMREQLRRYYPEMLELGGDLGAGWVLELWEKASTPAEAARVRKASVAAILKRNRIRRHDAVSVLRILRQQRSSELLAEHSWPRLWPTTTRVNQKSSVTPSSCVRCPVLVGSCSPRCSRRPHSCWLSETTAVCGF